MVGSRMVGREEGKDKIDGLAIGGFKIDGLFQANEQGLYFGQAFKPRMRNGNPISKARRAKALALPKRLEYDVRIPSQKGSDRPGDQLQQILFRGRRQIAAHARRL